MTTIFYGNRYSLERSADGNTLTFEAKFNVPVWSVTKYLVTNYPYDLQSPEADTPSITYTDCPLPDGLCMRTPVVTEAKE